ncbi:MAG: nitroreductase family protein [Treponema sp.]|jgi:nitroreductase|nr:nitroreductase family protein [Treponema sp.]
MNNIIQSLFERKSVRVFLDTPVPEDMVNQIIDAGIQAPSAGNQQLYTILDVRDVSVKERLAVLCDNQPFIAAAPVVLVFLADCRRWLDSYRYAGIEARKPGPGDLFLACADAVIAAQNMTVAAESLGLGSCYIGDILENKEETAELLGLDPLTFPAAMLVIGYPAESQVKRPKPPRPDRRYLVRQDRYRPLTEAELREMFADLYPGKDFDAFMTAFCKRKYMSAFSAEMNRSAGEYLKGFPGSGN